MVKPVPAGLIVTVTDSPLAQSPVDALAQASADVQTASYRAGKTALLGFFVGQVMKETKGSANPALVNEILVRLLSASASGPEAALEPGLHYPTCAQVSVAPPVVEWCYAKF